MCCKANYSFYIYGGDDLTDEEVKEINDKIDNLSKQIEELRVLMVSLTERNTRIDYGKLMKIAVFNYVTFRVLDNLTGVNGPVTNNLV